MEKIKKALLLPSCLLFSYSLSGQQDPATLLTGWKDGNPLPLLLAGALIIIMVVTYIAALIRERKRYRFLLNNMEEHILIINKEGEVLENVTGDIDLGNLQSLFGLEEWKELCRYIKKSCQAPPGETYRFILKSLPVHKSRYYRIVLQNMNHKREIGGYIITLLDITDTKKLEQELITSREEAYHQARHDMLTGIPNRLYFHEMVSRNFYRLKRNTDLTMCLLMLDLDHFKNVNDTWGHDIGDLVLKELTAICSKEIRGSDIFARYGGEEFIVYLDDLNSDEGLHVAERMRRKVEVHQDWPENIHITVSIGVAEYNNEEELENLIKKADIALYKAKALGRNKVCLHNSGEG